MQKSLAKYLQTEFSNICEELYNVKDASLP